MHHQKSVVSTRLRTRSENGMKKPTLLSPQVVSIGPFHHKNERLKAMEEHKERYYKSFVERSDQINLEDLVRVIREMEESLRSCAFLQR